MGYKTTECLPNSTTTHILLQILNQLMFNMKIFSTAGLFLAFLLCNEIFLVSCLGSGSTSTSTCIEQERQALLKFKQSLRDSEHRLSTWTGEDCCSWKGIQCDRLTSHVVKLELVGSSNPFSSTNSTPIEANEVSPSLLDLKYLKHLDLSGNNFRDIRIPNFLGSMVSLRYLNLSNSNFSGMITHHLGNLSMLRVLGLMHCETRPFDFYNCQSQGSLTIDDLTWVSRLSSLEYLDVSGVDLGQSRNLNKVLNTLSSLTELRMSGCQLDTVRLVSHFNFSSTVSNVEYLDLSRNSLAGEFPNFLENMTSLRVLDLYDNYLNSSIPLYLENFKSLEHLNLGYNSIVDVDGFSRLLLNQCSLKSLDMSQNPFEGEMSLNYGNLSGCATYHLEVLIAYSFLTGKRSFLTSRLPDWMGKFKNLKYLDLSWNSLTGPIPSFLGQLEHLNHLDLSVNSFTGPIPPSLGQLEHLNHLDLSVNSFTGPIPPSLGQLEHLNDLDLSSNLFSGSIPPSLGTFSALGVLQLSRNQLNGIVPVSLGQLSSLKVLDISCNQLEGVITEAHFANLSLLKEFRISSNFLTLKVKSEWIPPFQLNSILMGSCQIGTQFPQWLQSQKEVFELDISNASILGNLPEWLHEMPLFTLNLSHNHISGPIPKLPSTLTVLDLSNNFISGPIPKLPFVLNVLDLSNNLISGPLPQNISIMVPKLQTISLSGNLINGSIPNSMFEIVNLYSLDLSENSLSGNIPAYRGAFSALQVMILSSNQLSGVIPSSFGNLTALEWLHLNNNSLHGELPMGLRNCTSLIVLDLGENGFTGNIPRWIGEILALRVLRLHKNMFSGDIPPQFCQMFALQIMDLGNNNLTGPIPPCFGDLSGMILSESMSPSAAAPIAAAIPSSTPVAEAPSKDRNLSSPKPIDHWSEERMVQVIKGQELEFTKTLVLLANMDLSVNHLVGTIPEEITILSGLRGLNLSCNNLTGKIPEKIGGLTSLESLDFSKNQLSGKIPQSMSDLNSISHLNMSYNNLSGKIPTGNQLQTLNDPSIYDGNSELCGDPLPRKCPGDEQSPSSTTTGNEEQSEGDEFGEVWFIMSGYATGLCGVVGVLVSKKNWRDAYFQFVEMIKEKLLLGIALGVARLHRKINQADG